ncbi:hypothetical protein ACHAWF_002598 [Thalassiosira exigua]
MDFSTEAAYGPNCDPTTLENSDVRDKHEDLVSVASQDDGGKISSLDDALVKEKVTSTLSEANKLEEARKEHFAKLGETIAELEGEFKGEMKGLTTKWGSAMVALEEEQEVRTKIMKELNASKAENERISRELGAKGEELERLTLENVNFSELMKESVSKEELAAFKAELCDLRKEYSKTEVEFQSDAVLQLEVKSQEHDIMKKEMKSMCELIEVTSDDRDKAKRKLAEAMHERDDLRRMVDLLKLEITTESKTNADEFCVVPDRQTEAEGEQDALRPLRDKLMKAEEERDALRSEMDSSKHECDALRRIVNALKEKSKNLTKELLSSTEAFEDTIKSYDSAIAKVKKALGGKREENEVLRKNISELKSEGEKMRCALTRLEGEMDDGRKSERAKHDEIEVLTKALKELEATIEEVTANDCQAISALEKIHSDTLKTREDEQNAHREAVGVLKNELVAANEVAKTLRNDKEKLESEVTRLKTNFSEMSSVFEGELTHSCKASDAALQQKHDECETLKEAVQKNRVKWEAIETAGREDERKLKSELEELRSELADCDRHEHESTINSLQRELLEMRLELATAKSQEEDDKYEKQRLKDLLTDLERTKTEESTKYQSEIDQLNAKLEDATLSLDESRQLLSAWHSSEMANSLGMFVTGGGSTDVAI